MQKMIKAYLMRADSYGQLYRGYITKVENSSDFEQMYVDDGMDVYFVNDDIAIIGGKEAVIMGRTLNRAVYDESNKFVTVLAGDLIAVRHKGDSFISIHEEDIAVVEKLLKPIERIYCGKIFFKEPHKLKIWEGKDDEPAD